MPPGIKSTRSHLLSEEELQRLHETSLKILAEIGIKIEDEKLQARLQQIGCRLEGQRVKFPRRLVNDILAEREKLRKRSVNRTKKSTDKKVKERLNEQFENQNFKQTNEQTNEQTNNQTNEQTKEQINEQNKEQFEGKFEKKLNKKTRKQKDAQFIEQFSKKNGKQADNLQADNLQADNIQADNLQADNIQADNLIEEQPAELIIKNPFSGEERIFRENKLWSQPFGSVSDLLNPETNRIQPALTRDLIDFIQLQNRLDNIDFTGPSVIPTDTSGKIRELKMCEISLRYSTSPFSGLGISRSQEIDYIIELFRIVKGSQKEPPGMLGISPVSPLSYPGEITKIITKIVAAGIPVSILIAPVAGLTSPLTIAGSLAQTNASMLAFIVIAHLINPEAELIFSSRLSFPNMKKAYSIWGMPELGMASSGAVQLARFYNCYANVYGVSTTSCSIDVQTGYEKAFNALLPSLAGASIISGAGSLASGTVASKEQLIIDNEIISLVKRIVRGYEINEDTLAFDVIARAIEERGDFISSEHTVKHLQAGEVYHSGLGFDSLWHEWQEEEYPRMVEKAASRVKQILQAEQILQTEQILQAEQSREFDRVIKSAREALE